MNYEPLPISHIPRHIAIIMDGNRRWARARSLPPMEGHRHVADHILEPLIEHAAQRGISYVTLWAFSTENWNREKTEVDGLMGIFRYALKKFGERMHKKGIRIRMIGNLDRFPDDIRKTVNDLMDLTENNTRITVIFALNYGGRDEIMRAVGRYISDKRQETGDMKLSDLSLVSCHLSPDTFSRCLDTSDIPDPEMVIRPGGEQRLSGFLPWQSVYSELFFPVWYMPDFTPDKLDGLVAEYHHRSRRFGK